MQKAGHFLLCGKVTQADAPRGKGIAPILTDCQHRAGGKSVGRTGGFDRDTYPVSVQLSLEHGTLYAMHAQVQDMWHSICRAVDAHFWIAGKLCAQPVVQTADGCGAGGKFRSSLFQGQRQRAGKGHGRRTAAVGGSALSAVDEGRQCQPQPLYQHTDAVEPVKLMGCQAHGVHALKLHRNFPHSLRGVHMKMAVGIRL